MESLKLSVLAGSLLYSLLGVLIFWISLVVIDKLTPYDLWGEIVEKKNVALAIVVLLILRVVGTGLSGGER